MKINKSLYPSLSRFTFRDKTFILPGDFTWRVIHAQNCSGAAAQQAAGLYIASSVAIFGDKNDKQQW